MPSDDDGPVAVRPALGRAAPLVFSSPHSGRAVPPDFAPAVPFSKLIGYEDRFVDELIAGAPSAGIVLVAARFPRSYVDPNRAPDDLDRHVVDYGWTGPLAPSVYSEKGIGLVFRALPCGKAIYDRPLSHDALRSRIDGYWRPFHEALNTALEDVHGRWDRVWHVDWHSMRPVGDAASPDPGAVRPNFVVSDRDGSSAAPQVTEAVVETLRALGRSVAVNQPFKGGYVTRRHGRPADRRHSVQVEINRALYLDMESLDRGPGFDQLSADLSSVAKVLAEAARD